MPTSATSAFSRQRTTVFDLNDFDEAAPAPWEWDVKRLITSVIVGARERGYDDADALATAEHAASAYRRGLQHMMRLTVLERFYFRVDTDRPNKRLSSSSQRVVDKATKQARKRTSQAFVDKISTLDEHGDRLILENPPVLTHVAPHLEAQVEDLFEAYRGTVSHDIALLLSQFTLTDVARRVVGVGSVGTRCYILILTGPQGESLVLQIKEAQQSVLQSFGGAVDLSEHGHEGLRVITNQRILQAVSDSFLGYIRADGRDFYVRQFRDRKGSIDPTSLTRSGYLVYVDACATLLARAHSQSETAPAIAGYLGASDVFDLAVAEWSLAYANQSLADFRRLDAAVNDGSVEAIRGV